MDGLVRTGQPRESEVEHLGLKLRELEATLEERSTGLARTQAGLAAFKIRYRSEVGLLHEELDALELAIDEAERGEIAKRVAAGSGGDATPAADAPLDVPPRSTTDAVRRLFRDVAKAIHPDLAQDEPARDRRHALMIEANRAYATGDEARLRSILLAWENSPEAVLGSDTEAMRERLVRRIAQVEAQLAAVDRELAIVRESALWKLQAMVDEAAARGEDLIAEMKRRLARDVMMARNRLDALQWRPST